MQSTAERRVPRVPVQLTVEVCPEGFEEGFPADCVDVGYGGLAMQASLVPEVGERLRCRFAPPRGGEPVETECEVVWAQDRGPASGRFGLRFVRLGAREAEVVRALVDAAQGQLERTDRQPAPVRTELLVDGCEEALVGQLSEADGRLAFEQPLPFFATGQRARLVDGTPVRIAGLQVVAGEPPRLRVVLEPISVEHDLEASAVSSSLPFTSVEATWREPSPFGAEAAAEPGDAAERGGAEDSWRSLVGAMAAPTPSGTPAAAGEEVTGREPAKEAVAEAASGAREDVREDAVAFQVEADTDELLAEVARPAPSERLARAAGAGREAAVRALHRAGRLVARWRLHWLGLRRRLGAGLAAVAPWWLAVWGRLLGLLRRAGRTVALLARRGRSGSRRAGRTKARAPVRRTAAPRRTRRPAAARAMFPSSGWRSRPVLAVGLGALLVGAAVTMTLTPAPSERAERAPAEPAVAQPASAAERPSAAPAGEPSGQHASQAATAAPSPAAAKPPAAPAVDPEAGDTGAAEPNRTGEPRQGEVVEGPAFGWAEVPHAREHTIRLSLPVEKLRGVATPEGFLVVVPGALALDRAGPIAARHPYVERAMILNRGDRAELVVRFVAGKRPPYRVEVQGKRLRILVGK